MIEAGSFSSSRMKEFFSHGLIEDVITFKDIYMGDYARYHSQSP